jgi:hypothetical protein
MSASAYLLTVLSATLCVACVALMLSAYRQTGELLSPWVVFLGMSALDIYLPAALFSSVGLDLPPWLSVLAGDAAISSLLIFTLGAAFFAVGYFGQRRTDAVRVLPRRPSSRRVALLACVVAGLVAAGLAIAVVNAGGLGQYMAVRLTDRFAAPAPPPGLASLVSSIGTGLVPVLFVLAGVAFHDRASHPWLGVAVPVLAVVAAGTLFLRGNFLTLLLGLAIIERSRLEDLASEGSVEARAQSRRINRRIIVTCAAGLTLFVGYGTVRNYLTEEAYSGQATLGHAVGNEMSRFVRGEGFVGLTGVVHSYPREVPFLGGRTIGDMLLLPVPRAIWPSKPLWYGIDDITRAMGWPATTMSAVTMPGELYANFSVWGIPLMAVYGWIFGRVRRYRFGARFRYVYAFVFVPMMLPTFWMAFTGFVNQLVPIPLMAGALWFVFDGNVPGES